LETIKVLTSMTKLAATTAKRAMMFKARTTLRMMYPGPARDLVERRAIVRTWCRLKLEILWNRAGRQS